jgi:hypothetical protein
VWWREALGARQARCEKMMPWKNGKNKKARKSAKVLVSRRVPELF